jgi:hypothetical protein
MPRRNEKEKTFEELEGLYITKSFAHMLKDCTNNNDGIEKLKVQNLDSSQDNPYDNDSIEDGLINSLHVLYMGINA